MKRLRCPNEKCLTRINSDVGMIIPLDFTKPGGASGKDSVAGGVAGLFAETAALSIIGPNIAEQCSIRLPLLASRV